MREEKTFFWKDLTRFFKQIENTFFIIKISCLTGKESKNNLSIFIFKRSKGFQIT